MSNPPAHPIEPRHTTAIRPRRLNHEGHAGPFNDWTGYFTSVSSPRIKPRPSTWVALFIGLGIALASASARAQDQSLPQDDWQFDLPSSDLTEFLDTNTTVTLNEDDSLSLNVENVNISSVIRMLADIEKVNIVASEDVTGIVSSLNLYNVTFIEALNSILGINGYTYYDKGGIIYITTEEGKKEMPLIGHDLDIRTFKINHVEVTEIVETVRSFLSKSGLVSESADKKLVVQDSPEYLDRIERMIRELDVPPKQVLITAKLLTISREDNMTLGAEFMPFTLGDDGSDILTTGFAGDIDNLSLRAMGLFASARGGDVRYLIEALSKKANVDIIAAPQVLVKDGVQSHIQVGDRLGFRVVLTNQTSSLESIQFLEVGTQLDVTPHIADNGLIQMEILPKVSNGVVSAEGLPSENTTELSTTLLVENGHTVVIGGLINVSRSRVRSQVPFFGDIPYLGFLFGRNTWQDIKKELVILITPTIVEPFPSAEMVEVVDYVNDQEADLMRNKRILQRGENLHVRPTQSILPPLDTWLY